MYRRQITKIPQYTEKYMNFLNEKIGYSAQQCYFTDKLCFGTVYEAYKAFHRRGFNTNGWPHWGDVGYIDGDVICNTLWEQMSYNEEVFGTESPFLFMGKNDLGRFCDFYNKYDERYSDEAKAVFKAVAKAIKPWWMNGPSWTDGFKISGEIDLIDNYNLLKCLRDALQIIKEKNICDFEKNLIRREKMIKKIEQSNNFLSNKYNSKEDEKKYLNIYLKKAPVCILGDLVNNPKIRQALAVNKDMVSKLISALEEIVKEYNNKVEKANYENCRLQLQEMSKIKEIFEILLKFQPIKK